MSQNNKQPSLWKKFAGLFYHFEEEPVKPQVTKKQSPEVAKPEIRKPEPQPIADKFPFPGEPGEPVERKAAAVKSATELGREIIAEVEGDKPVISVAAKKEVKAASRRLAESFTSPVGLIHAPPIAEKRQYQPIVSFRNVTKIFNKGTDNEFVAIENVCFEIEDLPDVGEFIALVGPSGCGKSTVLNLIQGFQEVGPPTLGEILVRNRPINGPGRDRGMIFQKYSSFPHLTVLENVKFGLELNREELGFSDKTMNHLAMEMIKKVGLNGHEDKYPYQLSGGQQQRVAIARTLVLKPRIIFMDEPFSALDEPTRIEMQQLITDLWHEVEATVFIITHSLAEALYLSDRIFMFTPSPGRLNKQIMIPPEAIGKLPGHSPLEVQESPAFKAALKELTDEFLKIGEIN